MRQDTRRREDGKKEGDNAALLRERVIYACLFAFSRAMSSQRCRDS